MQNYKDLLSANETFSKLTPEVKARNCSYEKDKIFVIESTGARVSIDGSLDLLNMIVQKLNSILKLGKIVERFEEERGSTMKFK